MITSISNSKLTAQIKHLGAELCSLKNNTNTEFIWKGNPDFWGKHSPVLFPIVGTLKNNTYSIDNKEYKLSRHGFARDMEFELIKKEVNSVTFALKSSEKTLKLYPFKFELHIIYTLKETGLIIQYVVINSNNIAMPFSIGAHPAFSLTGNFEEYAIEFEQEESLNYFLLENDLVSNTTQKLETNNKKITLSYRLFDADALVFKILKSNSLSILKNSEPLFKINFEGFPNLGIWTKNNAPFICIEPWYGYSDTSESTGDLFEKEGIQILEANTIFKTTFSIDIF